MNRYRREGIAPAMPVFLLRHESKLATKFEASGGSHTYFQLYISSITKIEDFPRCVSSAMNCEWPFVLRGDIPESYPGMRGIDIG